MRAYDLIKTHRLSVFQLVFLSSFLLLQSFNMDRNLSAKTIPPAISQQHAQLLSFGEKAMFARGVLFWLQTFDSQAGKIVNYGSFNYKFLTAWFELAQSLDPASHYSLLTASRVFIETKNPEQTRQMVSFVHQQFLKSPASRWRWQLDVVMVAKYRLKDLALAQVLARDLRLHTKGQNIPAWVRDMEHLILEEQGEVEAAIMVIDNLLAEELLNDANEIRFLTQRLKMLIEKRQQ